MKGRKGSTEEGGVRSPLLVRGPGRVNGVETRVKQSAAAIDLFSDARRADRNGDQQGQALDGGRLAPLLFCRKADWPERMIFSHCNGNVSVRNSSASLDAAGTCSTLSGSGQDARRLRDDTKTAAASRMRREVEARRAHSSETEKGRRAVPLVLSRNSSNGLPARDGVPHGNVSGARRRQLVPFSRNWTAPTTGMNLGRRGGATERAVRGGGLLHLCEGETSGRRSK